MVKSFQGEHIVKKKEIVRQPILVRDYMTKQLVTFGPNQSIFEVVTKLLENKISGAPVINDKNELVGVISEGDCLKDIVSGKYHDMPLMHGKVEDHMAKNVRHISPDVSVFEASKMFLELKLRRFPVLDHNGNLVGQISQRDILRAITELEGDTTH
jgi:predicted transcriptional regulator